jgi:bifunctional non-homologous end joining protein LigD
MFRRRPPCFIAFDVLAIDGDDVRGRPLLERKRLLRRVVRAGGPVGYLPHVHGRGIELFREVCERDLEGVVAKLAGSAYRLAGQRSPWLKIKNMNYSQARGRHEFFERRRA